MTILPVSHADGHMMWFIQLSVVLFYGHQANYVSGCLNCKIDITVGAHDHIPDPANALKQFLPVSDPVSFEDDPLQVLQWQRAKQYVVFPVRVPVTCDESHAARPDRGCPVEDRLLHPFLFCNLGEDCPVIVYAI